MSGGSEKNEKQKADESWWTPVKVFAVGVAAGVTSVVGGAKIYDVAKSGLEYIIRTVEEHHPGNVDHERYTTNTLDEVARDHDRAKRRMEEIRKIMASEPPRVQACLAFYLQNNKLPPPDSGLRSERCSDRLKGFDARVDSEFTSSNLTVSGGAKARINGEGNCL